jgi:anthranilate phosphoribosyltransferase
MQDLRGGDAAFNAAAIRSVLAGAPGANRDIGVLNAAAALMVIGRVGDLAAGLELAYESIDSGRAATALEKLVATSQAAWAESGD